MKYFIGIDPYTENGVMFNNKGEVIRSIDKPKRLPRKEKKRRKTLFHRKPNPWERKVD